MLEPPGSTRPRILVIDDDAGIRLVTRLNLGQHGYDVLVADHGLDGLISAQEQVPDAIILDLMMPGVDGFQVLAQLRKDGRTKHVAVIVLTAMSVPAAHERALWLGAAAVEVKPFDPDHLVPVVNALISEGRELAPCEGLRSS